MLRETQGQRHDVDTPFGRPSDAVLETNWDGLPVFFLSRHGPGLSYRWVDIAGQAQNTGTLRRNP